jgi:5-methylthioadenosine/S-adenosylhomocysteine deaminase
MDGSARAAEALGQRVVMVPYVGAAPGYDYFDTLDDNARLIERWHGAAGGRIQAWVGLEHENYTTEAACRRAVAMCRHHGVGLHTHSNESHVEYAEAERRHGLTPVRALERLGLLDPERVLLAHCVWLQADELACLAAHGVGVAHNPTSNMKLASGTAPVAEMLAAGLAVGLGSDGEKENNNLDLFEEMKIASLLAKLRHLDAAAFDAWEVLHCATLGGARALGMQDQIGSLEVGKQADIVAVRADTPRMTPFLTSGPFMNLHHNLVHAVQGGDVTMTMVAGRVLVEDGQLRSGHLPDCIAQAETACADLLVQRQDWLGRQEHGMQVAT